MSHSIQLFNTLSRQKESFKPMKDNHVKMYTCGPTVYHYAHIGNFRTYVFEDVLRRTLKYFGYKVTQVMNLTDVDDKTIRGAIAKGTTLNEYTQPFVDAFFEDLKTLQIEPAEHYPAATDYIEEMIKMIQVLLDKKVAYEGGDGSIYYAINKFPHYGCLSHLHLDELKVGASNRVANDEYDKDNIADFVLWKKYDPERDGQIYWESPYGKGRPGWHLECSAMAINILGDTLDLHIGGVDNMFPHHENEIAQSEAYSGKQFVKHWMHAEHLVVDNKKMSKSLGNFFTLRDLLNKGFTGIQVRYLLLQTHYRSQLNFTFQSLEAAKNSLERLNDFIVRLKEIELEKSHSKLEPIILKTENDFKQALADDLNISAALGALFDLVRDINSLCDQQQVSKKEAQKVLELLKSFNSVLGILSFENTEEEISPEIEMLMKMREEARQNKQWKRSDELRDQIHQLGYMIIDTPTGVRVKKA